MASARRAARLLAAVPPVLVTAEPSSDWKDYVDLEEKPPPYWPADEVPLWRQIRARRRMNAARKLWLAESGAGGS